MFLVCLHRAPSKTLLRFKATGRWPGGFWVKLSSDSWMIDAWRRFDWNSKNGEQMFLISILFSSLLFERIIDKFFCASGKLSSNFVGFYFAKYTGFHEGTYSTPLRNLSSTLWCNDLNEGEVEFLVYLPTYSELCKKEVFWFPHFQKRHLKFFSAG